MLELVKSSDHALSIQTKLDALAKNYLQQSLSPSTRKFYAIDWRLFTAWCEALEIPSFPATSATVTRFLAYEAHRGIKPQTLIRRLAAIRLMHEMQGQATPTHHPGVRAVLKGIKRDKGAAPCKKAPATIERIESMIAHCPNTLIGLRNKALLLLGFAGALRRAELVALRVQDLERTPEGMKITIRQSKTDQEGQGQVIAILNGTRLRVVDFLLAWLEAAHITEGPLFRPIKKGSHIQPQALTCRSVANVVKHYAKQAGLMPADFSGHSLRAGFITSGAQAGANLFKLMEVSRHKKPETVLGYVREAKLFEDHAGKDFL